MKKPMRPSVPKFTQFHLSPSIILVVSIRPRKNALITWKNKLQIQTLWRRIYLIVSYLQQLFKSQRSRTKYKKNKRKPKLFIYSMINLNAGCRLSWLLRLLFGRRKWDYHQVELFFQSAQSEMFKNETQAVIFMQITRTSIWKCQNEKEMNKVLALLYHVLMVDLQSPSGTKLKSQ